MDRPGETVVLVHGLWMHGVVFVPYRRWLGRLGYRVRAFSYPSVRLGIDANARALSRFVASCSGDRIHLVGHSLGGLVVLNALTRHPDPRIGRVVLLGSPCAGSHCATVLMRMPGIGGIVGQSIRDWMTRPAAPLPPAIDIGVIAGTRRFGLGRVIPGLPRPNDGVVSLAETRLPGCRDAIALPVAHSEMLVSPTCATQVAAFLGSGRFRHAPGG